MIEQTSKPREERNGERPVAEPHPLEAALLALEEGIGELVSVLDAELEAALAGDSRTLEAHYARKLVLADSLERWNATVRAALQTTEPALLPTLLTDARKGALEAANAALRSALARNEAGLRAATEAVRRVFEAAARAAAAEDIGYGPGRLPGDARLFASRTV
jgi:hypothetical protein